MNKIGVLTIYSVPNFGSVLQAYATQVLLEKLGYECVFIDYRRENEWYYAHGAYKLNVKDKLLLKLGLFARHRKAKCLEKFRKQFLHLSRSYWSLEELEREDWASYKEFVVGSDQVWNTRFSYGDSVYLLSFLPDEKRKISFSSSFALKELSSEYIEKFKKYLSRFTALSVREQHGVEIIRKQLGIDVDVALTADPTLTLSANDWLNALPRSSFKKKEKYILLYMLDYAFKPQPYIYDIARQLQKKYGYKIYVLEGKVSEVCGYGLECKSVIDSDILKFLDYFHNADIVLTSSFHGTAFALNFGRPLVSVVPDGGDDRQSSLLKSVGLPQLAVKVGTGSNDINPFYNVDKEQENLKMYRNKTIEWMKSVL